MNAFVVGLHIVLCLLLVLIIILQPGKGDIGSAFGGGGGASGVFGARGPAGLLARGTTVVAVMFMVTSITLAYYSDKAKMTGDGSEIDVRDEAFEELQRRKERRGQQQPEALPQE